MDDRDWFEGHPGRAYRLRPGYEGWWIIERRPGGELLCTWMATITPSLPDTDAALREAWQAAAFPRRCPAEECFQRLDLFTPGTSVASVQLIPIWFASWGPTMTWSMWVAVVVVVIGLVGLVSCFWDLLRKPPH